MRLHRVHEPRNSMAINGISLSRFVSEVSEPIRGRLSPADKTTSDTRYIFKRFALLLTRVAR